MAAPPPQAPAPSYRFDRFELRPAERALQADGRPVRIGGRAFDMLVALVERRDRVVGKHELMDLVWPNLFVEENNLQVQIMALRKLMGPAAIATVPGRGYRLTLAVRPDAAHPTAAPSPIQPLRTNLPRSVEPLIGRERELAQLRDLIATHRVVTVTGPGGVGKSRLAVDAGWTCVDRFANGVWLVELASLGDGALVPSAIITALGIATAASADPMVALARQLGDAKLMIVLDNCEHLVDAVASTLESLLSATPNLHVLASSQEPVGIHGEHVLRLPSLGVPADANPSAATALQSAAVQLFAARARAADPKFALNDANAAAVASICRRLDGIPLAIEMAAGRAPLLGMETLAARLDERFRLLTAGKRTALPRQRTLQATLDWSYGLLSRHERAVFRRLGVFPGSFTLAAASGVAADADDDELVVVERLAALCDKSLVATEDAGSTVRYRLLESARAYALERLSDAGETADVARRHAMHCRERFEACFDDWTSLSDAAFRARYAPEIDDLRAAIDWALGPGGDDETAVALVGSSALLWTSLSLHVEVSRLAEAAVERLTPAMPTALRADAWSAMANAYGQRNQRRTIDAARTAAELYRTAGDSMRLGCALHALGAAHASEGSEGAEALLAEARTLLAATGRPRLLAMSHGGFALLHATKGRSAAAMEHTQEALPLWRAAGADAAVLRTLGALADQVWAQGDLDRATSLARGVLELHDRSPFADRVSRAYTSANLVGMLVEHGDLEAASALGRRLLPELVELDIAHGWSDHYASYFARTGCIDVALRLVGWADALRQARGLNRQPNEQRAREAVLALARERAAAGEVERLLGEGAALCAAEAHHLMSPARSLEPHASGE
jgi:predicted ATPase/DNA-binding winged helix-turn-helix (wHTH) protein